MLAVLASALAIASSCGAWHADAAGAYPGVVQSDGPKSIDTWIEQTADGRLRGRYVLHEPTRDVPGVLDPAGDEGCHVAVFRWTDLYGSGLVRLTFDTEHHCFDGAWGGLTINPALVWHACLGERPTS